MTCAVTTGVTHVRDSRPCEGAWRPFADDGHGVPGWLTIAGGADPAEDVDGLALALRGGVGVDARVSDGLAWPRSSAALRMSILPVNSSVVAKCRRERRWT